MYGRRLMILIVGCFGVLVLKTGSSLAEISREDWGDRAGGLSAVEALSLPIGLKEAAIGGPLNITDSFSVYLTGLLEGIDDTAMLKVLELTHLEQSARKPLEATTLNAVHRHIGLLLHRQGFEYMGSQNGVVRGRPVQLLFHMQRGGRFFPGFVLGAATPLDSVLRDMNGVVDRAIRVDLDLRDESARDAAVMKLSEMTEEAIRKLIRARSASETLDAVDVKDHASRLLGSRNFRADAIRCAAAYTSLGLVYAAENNAWERIGFDEQRAPRSQKLAQTAFRHAIAKAPGVTLAPNAHQTARRLFESARRGIIR
jgi:hypothetical protein